MLASSRPIKFGYLDPTAPRTERIIKATLTVNVPWHDEHAPTFQPAELAERIDRRAQEGFTVHLKPDTARTVALTLRLYVEGHPDLRNALPHWTAKPHQVLAIAPTPRWRLASGKPMRPNIRSRRGAAGSRAGASGI